MGRRFSSLEGEGLAPPAGLVRFRPIADIRHRSIVGTVRAGTKLLLMIGALPLAACEPRHERLRILEASNLRREIAHSTNEHVVLLDIKMSEDEWKKIDQKDVTLEYQGCPSPHRNMPSFYNYGVHKGAIARTTFQGFPALRITFDMFSTNVPSEVESAMKDITCVELNVDRGYGRTSYYSDRVRVMP